MQKRCKWNKWFLKKIAKCWQNRFWTLVDQLEHLQLLLNKLMSNYRKYVVQTKVSNIHWSSFTQKLKNHLRRATFLISCVLFLLTVHWVLLLTWSFRWADPALRRDSLHSLVLLTRTLVGGRSVSLSLSLDFVSYPRSCCVLWSVRDIIVTCPHQLLAHTQHPHATGHTSCAGTFLPRGGELGSGSCRGGPSKPGDFGHHVGQQMS